MIRMLLGMESEFLSASDEAAVSVITMKHQRLLFDGGRLDTKTEAGYNACALFLDALESAARALRLNPEPRSYRQDFTINYRALFAGETRNYRVDVLEASVDQYAVMWVNGDKFEFSADVMLHAEALQRAWAELEVLMDRWNQTVERSRGSRPNQLEIR